MRQLGVAILAIGIVAGCHSTRPCCPPPEPAFICQPMPIVPSMPLGPTGGCGTQFLEQQRVEQPVPVTYAAVVANGTVKVDAITIQGVQGVNAVYMLAALRAAIKEAKYSASAKKAPSVIGDTITIDLEPISQGEFAIEHRVVAEIQSGATTIGIQVSSRALDNQGRPINARVSESQATQVLDRISLALAGKAAP